MLTIVLILNLLILGTNLYMIAKQNNITITVRRSKKEELTDEQV